MSVLAAAAEAMRGLHAGRTWQLSEAEVAEALGHLGEIRARAEQAEVALATEVVERGIASGHGAVDWTVQAQGERAPRRDAAEVARILRVARACQEPGLSRLAAAFSGGSLTLAKADRITSFAREVRHLADPRMLEEQVDLLVDAASDTGEGPGLTLRQLTQAIRYASCLIRSDEELEHEERRMRASRGLTRSRGPAGMTTYRLLLDPEGAAVVDAAVAALSAPSGTPEEPDLRGAATRRADALLEVMRRGVASPGTAPRAEKAQVVVTISLEALLGECRGIGLTSADEVLSAATVRRMACDAAIIPMVLGGDGEVLDVGRKERFFTPGQRRAIIQRDRGCTFPGCTMPADWCEAHHVVWWARGGLTDVDNGALLCQRHHTVVHQRDLTATVSDTRVTWHL